MNDQLLKVNCLSSLMIVKANTEALLFFIVQSIVRLSMGSFVNGQMTG